MYMQPPPPSVEHITVTFSSFPFLSLPIEVDWVLDITYKFYKSCALMKLIINKIG